MAKASNWLAQNQHITKGLKDLTSVIPPDKYRVFGSLIAAALDKPFKRIGDIDVFCDQAAKNRTIKKFKQLGYQVTPVWGFGNLLGVVPLRFSQDQTMIDIFFGQVKNHSWRYHLKLNLNIYIPPLIWQDAHQLKLGRVKFTAMPPSSVYYAMSILNQNKFSVSKPRPGLSILKQHADLTLIEKYKQQKPGFYFGNTYLPLTDLFVKLAALAEIIEGLIKKV
jgi:hypothetical protein